MNDGFANSMDKIFNIAKQNGGVKELYYNKIVTKTGVTIHFYRWNNTTFYVAPRMREIYYNVEK